MNPAFPAVVYPIPICWTMDAAPIKMPQMEPWIKRDLIYCLSLSLRILTTRGRSTTKPMHILIPLYMKGPMLSAAWLWNAKVKPQISEARRSSRIALFSFIRQSISKGLASLNMDWINFPHMSFLPFLHRLECS